MAERLHFLQGHNVADWRFRPGLDGDDPPIRSKVRKVAPETNGVSLRQPLALDPKKDRLSVIRAKEIATWTPLKTSPFCGIRD